MNTDPAQAHDSSGMAEAAAIAGPLVGVAGNAVLAPIINRYRDGRQVARKQTAVYIPGEGRMIEFQSIEQNRKKYRDYLRREKWIIQYLKHSVINLAELASALSATQMLVVRPSTLLSIENTVIVLGTTDPAQKLEGIMLAFREGFLQARTDQNTVPWGLLHDAKYPAEPWRKDYKLVDIWFALHCEYIFPVNAGKVIGAADTLSRIRLATSGPPPIVTHQGKEIERHYEVPMQRLIEIAERTDQSLIGGPVNDIPSVSVRAAGILGGARTLELLGKGCAVAVTNALKEVERVQISGLQVLEVDGVYMIQTSCSQARAESDFQAKGPKEFWLAIPKLGKICFTNCKTVDGALILQKRLDELVDNEVFRDVQNVHRVCQRVDQSMGLNKKKTRYSEECRLGEAVGTEFCEQVIKGGVELQDDDFARVNWAFLEYENTALVVEWKQGIHTCVVDTIGSRVSVSHLRLPIDEPDHIWFINILGTDLEVETRQVSLPVGQGFKQVDFAEAYCYLQHQNNFVGRHKKVGRVGKWHQTLSGISFEGDGDGVLGEL